MINIIKNGSFLFFLVVVTVVIFSSVTTKEILSQTPKVQDFEFIAIIDCDLNQIKEVDKNGVASFSIYDYPVEFLAKSITKNKDSITLHDAFLYKHTCRHEGQQFYTEYFDPKDHPENFYQSVTIYPQNKIVIKENRKNK